MSDDENTVSAKKVVLEDQGTVLEEQVLAHNKVVSIQSRSGWDSEPPFSEEGLKSPNLQCLTFDAVTDYSDRYDAMHDSIECLNAAQLALGGF